MEMVYGVILPDGRFDMQGAKFLDDELKAEATPVLWPHVSDDPYWQEIYECFRIGGDSHAFAFAMVTRRMAGRILAETPLKDGDTITFVRLGLPCEDDVVSQNFDAQVNFWLMLLKGESRSMAEMLATRSFPGLKTDSIFNEGKFSSDSGQIGQEQLWLQKQAEAAGVSTNGKWYCRGLASYPGDPTAWVGDRGDVLRVAREKNMTVQGYVEHKGHEVDPGGDVAIASDLVDSEVADILESNPFANPEEVREQVTAVRSGAVDTNPLLCGDYESTDIP